MCVYCYTKLSSPRWNNIVAVSQPELWKNSFDTIGVSRTCKQDLWLRDSSWRKVLFHYDGSMSVNQLHWFKSGNQDLQLEYVNYIWPLYNALFQQDYNTNKPNKRPTYNTHIIHCGSVTIKVCCSLGQVVVAIIFIPYRIQQHDTVCMTYITNSRVIIDNVVLYHTWVWNRGICMCVIVRPRSHMLIVLKKSNPWYNKIWLCSNVTIWSSQICFSVIFIHFVMI